MKYLFDDTKKQEELKETLESWIDPPTPYRHHCGIKGLGCDCIHFVAKVLEEMGILKWRKNLIPDYPQDWHMHSTRELLCESIERELRVEKVELDKLMNGDIVCSHFGQASSHAGVYFDRYIYQAIDDVGVKKLSIRHPFFNLKFAYRILA